MAESILSSLVSKAQFTVTSVDNGQRLITGVKVIKSIGRLTSIIPRHRKEDGSSVVDSRMLRGAILAVDMIAPTIDDVEDVVNLMNNRTQLLTIYSKGVVYPNMMVNASSTRQSAEMISAAPFQLQFKQQLLQKETPVNCEQAGDSDMIDQGIQAVQSVTSSVSDLYTKVSNSISGVFGG